MAKSPTVAQRLEVAEMTIADLRAQLAALESRRRFEIMDALKTISALRAKTEGPKRLAPSMDMSIPDDQLTPGQRAIRAHRAGATT